MKKRWNFWDILLYYIIAETATDETEALDALNTVLFNRGVKELEDKTQLAGMLRDEYRREFFGEGQLFFYYKRLRVSKKAKYPLVESDI